MRKILAFCAFSIILSLWIPFICFAAPIKAEFQDYINQQFGTSYSNTTDNAYNALIARMNAYPDYPIAICYINNSYYSIFVGSTNSNPNTWSYTVSNGKLTINSGAYINNTYGNITWDSQSLYNVSPYILWENKAAFERSFITIDFDNVNYMPSLPTPKPRIDYVTSWNPVTLINNVINPVVPYQLTYDPATAITGMMYVETYIKFSRPTLINVSLSGVIDTYNDVWSDPVYINTMQSQTLLSDLSTVTTPYILDLSAYNQDWENFKDSVNVTYTFDDNVPTALRQTYQDVFENKFNCVGLGGNNFALYQRYFIIDTNSNVYCGDWYVWNSGRVSKVKSDDVNKDFKPGEQPNGTINVVQPDYVNDTSDNYAPSNGTSTGNDGLLTIVNNLVPNYPDYPTAVSYNHDHVLTQFITTSKQLPGFFGSFGDFLKECFSFIDSSVWTVICTGFSCCIVIMIIKVL